MDVRFHISSALLNSFQTSCRARHDRTFLITPYSRQDEP